MKSDAINDPADCVICRRYAWSLGIPWLGRQRYICLECAEVANEIKLVTKPKFVFYEQEATVDAGAKGGALLDEIGETDLAKLTQEQFDSFVRAVVVGFGDSLRAQIAGMKAPF